VYPIYTVVVTALVHPMMVHWIWVDSSWLNTLSSCRVLDFAGALAVHALGEQPAAGMHMLFICCMFKMA
jgi:ammonia channel protein AmtB